jgi:DNA-binding HxlR family transcriptional regulator
MPSMVFNCGLDVALSVIGGKWKPLILYHLANGPRRYGELKRAVGGVSDKMLIQQLKELHVDGVIDRRDYQEVPPKVDYSLTPFGKTLAKALAPLCVWGTENVMKVEQLMARRDANEVVSSASLQLHHDKKIPASGGPNFGLNAARKL